MLACDAGYDVSTGASELSTKKRQVGLEDAFAAEKRLKLDRDLLKGIFYQGNIALTAFDTNPHLSAAISNLAGNAGLPGYVPLNKYRIGRIENLL